MKKFFMMFALVAMAGLVFTGCNKTDQNTDEALIAKVQAASIGSWIGKTMDGEDMTVTFSVTKVAREWDDEGSPQYRINNIVAWKAVGGKVYVTLDDDMGSNMYVDVSGNTMTLSGNSTFILVGFPASLTRK